jgi:hypothetical protein
MIGGVNVFQRIQQYRSLGICCIDVDHVLDAVIGNIVQQLLYQWSIRINDG